MFAFGQFAQPERGISATCVGAAQSLSAAGGWVGDYENDQKRCDEEF